MEEKLTKSRKKIYILLFLILLICVLVALAFDKANVLDKYANFVTSTHSQKPLLQKLEPHSEEIQKPKAQECPTIDIKLVENYLDIAKNFTELHIKFLKGINIKQEVKFLKPYMDATFITEIEEYNNKYFTNDQLQEVSLGNNFFGRIIEKFVTIKKGRFQYYYKDPKYQELEEKINNLRSKFLSQNITENIIKAHD